MGQQKGGMSRKEIPGNTKFSQFEMVQCVELIYDLDKKQQKLFDSLTVLPPAGSKLLSENSEFKIKP